MTRWMRQAGLVPRNVMGMHYNPIFRTCSLGGNTDINYLVHAKRPEAGSE
jgi:2-polyprenyl-6-hydroxyphenyl methylase/3-demethylubiquinone-9 3-methyltransferase